MNRLLGSTVLILGAWASSGAFAQAPAGATGQCKDSSYTTAAKKWQACAGHKGVQTWFADAKAGTPASNAAVPVAAVAPSAATQPAPSVAPAAAPATSRPAAKSTVAKSESTAARTTAAPGGGPGLVWVNTSTNVYHCPGGTFYGKTKDGKYMSEGDAKTAGARPDRGKACTK